jgi:hypothetical protein
MTEIQLLTDLLRRDIEFVKGTLGDFSDADLLARPCAGANHTAWQLGHLIGAEARMINAVQEGAVPLPPAGFDEKFRKETASVDDPAFFPRKTELLDAMEKGRNATINWVKTLKPSDLDRPTPERLRRFAPTVGQLLAMLPVHVAMHVGQFQVTRRKLGKPVLF